HIISFLMLPRTPTSTLFPYTTLFRSPVPPSTRRSILAPSDPGGRIARVIPAQTPNHLRPGPHCCGATGLGKVGGGVQFAVAPQQDRKSTRLNSSHVKISYAVFCLKKK